MDKVCIYVCMKRAIRVLGPLRPAPALRLRPPHALLGRRGRRLEPRTVPTRRLRGRAGAPDARQARSRLRLGGV